MSSPVEWEEGREGGREREKERERKRYISFILVLLFNCIPS